MKTLKSLLTIVGCAAALLVSTQKTQAQGRGNWDPAQMRQERINRFKDQLSITNDDEWKVVEAAIGKVMDADRDVMANSMALMFGAGRPRNNDNNDGENADRQNRRPRGGGLFGTPSPEIDDLKKAIDDKAPIEDIKAKLAKVREVTAEKEAKLAAAQEDLKKLLTTRQEAIAVANGILK